MKQRISSFFIGVLTTIFCLTMITPVLASFKTTNIEVAYGGIKIFIDDDKITPRDTNGKEVVPFIFNGTTYLPVRAICDALDKPVSWDGKTKSIYIGKHSSDKPICFLSDLDPIKYNNIRIINIPKDNYGNTYTIGIGKNSTAPRLTSSTYYVNGHYSKLKGNYILDYKYKNTKNEGVLKIFGDNQLLYQSDPVKSGDASIPVSVDISGVLKLKVVIESTDYIQTILADPELYQ